MTYPAIQVYRVHIDEDRPPFKERYHLTTTAPSFEAAIEEAQLLQSSMHLTPKHCFIAAYEQTQEPK